MESRLFWYSPDQVTSLPNHSGGVKERASSSLLNSTSARINPETARSLRKAAVRYRFFERPSRAQDEDIEVRNNYRDQKRQYQKDVRNMGRYYNAFFAASFGENYTLEE